ncbi:hypothetical protein ISN76_13135 [Dyella halodurans]|uniref:Uncharacterized protein n=1 Tax=Dyella halodurans TaxID=1920171 RepID=A0ABV9C0C6_9GAMM|nr:hypothetical protein [Dyella halodurans]
MSREVTYQAERVGTAYRGMVIDTATGLPVFITPHNYSDPTVAKEAARRTYQEKQELAA